MNILSETIYVGTVINNDLKKFDTEEQAKRKMQEKLISFLCLFIREGKANDFVNQRLNGDGEEEELIFDIVTDRVSDDNSPIYGDHVVLSYTDEEIVCRVYIIEEYGKWKEEGLILKIFNM